MSDSLCHRDWLSSARLSFPELLRFHSPEMARHVVQFYDDDVIVVEHVARLAAKALAAGSSAVIVATEAHIARISEHLTHLGPDLDDWQKLGRFVTVDAVAALSHFMVNDYPQEAAFDRSIGTIMRTAAERSATGFCLRLW